MYLNKFTKCCTISMEKNSTEQNKKENIKENDKNKLHHYTTRWRCAPSNVHSNDSTGKLCFLASSLLMLIILNTREFDPISTNAV